MRYVMRSAYFRESSNLWTHIALPVTTGSMLIWVSANPTLPNYNDWRRTMWLKRAVLPYRPFLSSNSGLCEIILQTRCTSPHGNGTLRNTGGLSIMCSATTLSVVSIGYGTD